MFREVMLNRPSSKMPYWGAILISAIVFGVIHFNIIQGLGAFFGGLFYGYIYVKTKNLFVPIIIHLINNGLMILSLNFKSSFGMSEQAADTASIVITICLIVSGSICAVVFYKSKGAVRKKQTAKIESMIFIKQQQA